MSMWPCIKKSNNCYNVTNSSFKIICSQNEREFIFAMKLPLEIIFSSLIMPFMVQYICFELNIGLVEDKLMTRKNGDPTDPYACNLMYKDIMFKHEAQGPHCSPEEGMAFYYTFTSVL